MSRISFGVAKNALFQALFRLCYFCFFIKCFVPAASYFPSRVSSLQQSLTSVFGMRTGVTSATNHQNKIFNAKKDKRKNSSKNIWKIIPHNRAQQHLVFKFPNKNRQISTSWLNT